MKNILEMFIIICRKHLALLDILHCRQTQMLPLIVLIQRNLSPTMVWDFYSACSVVHIRMYLNNTSSCVFCTIPFHDAIPYNTIPTIPYHTLMTCPLVFSVAKLLENAEGSAAHQRHFPAPLMSATNKPRVDAINKRNKQTNETNKRNKQMKQTNETNKRNKQTK